MPTVGPVEVVERHMRKISGHISSDTCILKYDDRNVMARPNQVNVHELAYVVRDDYIGYCHNYVLLLGVIDTHTHILHFRENYLPCFCVKQIFLNTDRPYP